MSDKSALREKLKLPLDKFIILYAGHFIKRKNINVLLQAINILNHKVKNSPLGVFIGYGLLEYLINSSKGVISKGLQPYNLIPSFMKAADVLVLPSYSEGLGNVLVEAGAAGLPVVGSNVGGISELLAGGRGILIKPGSAEAIVEAINKVRSDYQSALQRAGKLKKYVEKHYNVDKNAEIIINEYKNLIQND
ncbi:MAG: glycosyltransferase family 4 protein [Bacteroidetes bacterium]|nr:glycosyltransferase family 4 protein [Bacteroidota bacterium]